jgi:hypothetical protein
VEYDKPPILTVNGTISETYKVGDTLSIPTYTLTDSGVDVDVEVNVYLKDPDGQLREITNEYTFEKAGKYQVIYRAVDEYYNVTRIVYDVTVQ